MFGETNGFISLIDQRKRKNRDRNGNIVDGRGLIYADGSENNTSTDHFVTLSEQKDIMFGDETMEIVFGKGLSIVNPKNNEIYYTTSDKQIVSPNTNLGEMTATIYGNVTVTYNNVNGVFGDGVEIVSNKYIGRKGVITFNKPITKIGGGAFQGCTTLTSMILPEGIDDEIYQVAFQGCTSLKYIILPEKVKGIGQYAFYGCTSLKNIFIPPYVEDNNRTTINPYAFGSCPSLVSIEVSKGNPNFDSRNDCNAIIKTNTNVMLTGCKNTVIPFGVKKLNYTFHGCTGLEIIEIPNSVNELIEFVFTGCTSLEKLTIPASVTKIGDYCFNECPNLKSISFLNETPPSITEFTFFDISNDMKFYVPSGSVNTYKETTIWSNYADKIEALPE